MGAKASEKFDAHEKAVEFVVGVLIGVHNIAVVPKNEIADRGDKAFPVGAGD
jgi:hypothetical protein